MSTTIYGTSYFKTLFAARDYYADYVPSYTRVELAKYVAYKMNNGEIHIGQPPLKPNEKLLINESEGRYFIEVQN